MGKAVATEFDDFLLKTERVLAARRAAEEQIVNLSKKISPKEDFETLRRMASLEWSKLLISVTEQTSGKMINKDRFLAYGRTGVMLGKIILVLKAKRDERGSRPISLAEYRTSTPDGDVIKLAEVSIEPSLSRIYSGERKIFWVTVGLDHSHKMATSELATVLAMKLVDVYQATVK